MELVEDTAERETVGGQKRMAPAQEDGKEEEVKEVPKRPREDGKEEEWMLSHLTWFRREWTDMWSDHFGDVEKRSTYTYPFSLAILS
jgi:hypothetical protein